MNPAPTRDIPVLIGGGGEKKTLKLVAKHADIWHSFGDVETTKRKVAILHEHCASVGRDPSEIEISVAVPGDHGDIVEKAKAQLASGATLFTYGVGGPDYDLEPLKRLVAWRDSAVGGA